MHRHITLERLKQYAVNCTIYLSWVAIVTELMLSNPITNTSMLNYLKSDHDACYDSQAILDISLFRISNK